VSSFSRRYLQSSGSKRPLDRIDEKSKKAEDPYQTTGTPFFKKARDSNRNSSFFTSPSRKNIMQK